MLDKIKKATMNNHKVAICCIILIQILVTLVLGNFKSNFHQDELFSLETAHYMADSTPENMYMHQTDMFEEKTWLEISDFKPLLTVDSSSSLTTDSPTTIIKKFVFDNAYEWMINMLAGSLVPGGVSKWIGIVINIPFIIIAQLLLYKMVLALRGNKSLAIVTVAWYGLSAISLGFSVYTRFYCFVLAMIMIAVYLHYKMWSEKKIWKILFFEIVSYFCLFEAFVASELVAIIVAGLYFSYLVGVLIRKSWKQVIIHVSPVIIGFGYFLKEYLSFFKHIIQYPDKYIHEGEPLDLMIKGATNMGVRSLIKRIYFYTSYLGDYLFGSIIILVLLVAVFIYIVIRNRKDIKTKTSSSDTYIYVILGVVCIYSIFSIVVALWLPRYYALIYPLIAIIVVCAFDRVVQIEKSGIKNVVYTLFIIGIVIAPFLGHVDNVYYSERASIKALDNIDASVRDHVIWNMEDFQIIMECVYQADADDRFYVCSEDEELDYTVLGDEFLLWVNEGKALDEAQIAVFLEQGYSVEDSIGIVADAYIYHCMKNN